MKIGFIGSGQMARALARGFVDAHLAKPSQILAADCFEAARTAFLETVPGAQVSDDNTAVANEVDVVFLSVKPQHAHEVAKQTGPIPDSTLLISIVAGVPISRLTEWFQAKRVIRVMPNTPSLVGHGAAGFCLGDNCTRHDAQLAEQFLSATGFAFELPEKLLDAVTGLSGSGPAFVYQFIEALGDGGVKMGIPRPIASQLAAQTVLGAAAMVLETGQHPGVLKDQVASPAGTTIAGLHALEQGGLRAAVMNAVEAATKRSQELGNA